MPTGSQPGTGSMPARPHSSRSTESAVLTLIGSLLGLCATAVLYVARDPLLLFAAVFVSGIILVIVAALLSSWHRRYARRRHRTGQLPRGQEITVVAFGVWLLQLAAMLLRLALSAFKWRGL